MLLPTSISKVRKSNREQHNGKQLLQHGNLRRRVTIIPLNKIQYYTVSSRVRQAAVSLVGKENAEIALSLVGYEEELKNAMEYVFGSTFVCKTISLGRAKDCCKMSWPLVQHPHYQTEQSHSLLTGQILQN
jgi:chromosome segregation ATPase